MRSIRLAVLVAPALLAALLLVPRAFAGTTLGASADPTPALAMAQAETQAQVSFASPASLAAGLNPVSVAVGDFDGGGDPDLAVANQLSNDVSVLLGGAGGGFTGPTNFPVGFFTFPFSVAVGNFNDGGDPDLAVANLAAGNVSVLQGGTGGSFVVPPASFPAGSSPASVAVGDFDGNGDPDLAVANQTFAGRLSVLLGGTGSSFSGPASFPAGTNPISVAVGNFNGDTDPDLAVANRDSNNVSVLLGGSGGGFTGPTNLAAGNIPSSVAVDDFNGDGDPDLAVANQTPAGRVSVLLGGTGGSFVVPPTPSFAAGTNPASVAVGDFNSDGDPDLAVANLDSNNVSVLLGVGDGTFTAPINFPVFPVGNGPTSVAVGDFNGDGKPDLAVANVRSNNVSVLLNNTITNQAPTAADDVYTTDEDTALNVDAPGVLGNDSDPNNGDTLTAAMVSGPSHGTVTLDADGSFTYTPAANYSGSDSFTYQASDGTAASNPATVTITVSPVNDAPAADDDAYSTAEDTALTVAAPGVLSNDSDLDSTTLSAVVGSGPSHGTLTLQANGSFTYTPDANHTGEDSFTYQVSDGTLTSGVATVTITVGAVNDAPTVAVAAGGRCGTDDRSGTINLTVGDVETAAADLTLSAASSNPALVPTGNIVLAGDADDRTLTVSSVAGRSGTATVTVTVTDGEATGSVKVTVKVGSNGNDTALRGEPGTNLIFGQNGNDTLTGGDAYDLLCGGNSNDILSGGGGDDSLGGAAGNDRLTGGSGADYFSGGIGKDAMTDFDASQGDTTDGTIP
jgi:VCBS repeat-containing protein